MLTEFKTIFLFFSSAISSFSYYYHPYFTIIGIALMIVAVIGLLTVFILNLIEKYAEKKSTTLESENKDILEEIKKNREKN